MDFPRAWAIARAVPYEEHEEKCSYRTETGAFLCDCKVLTEHPEYGDQPAPEPLTEAMADMDPEGFFATEQEKVAEEQAWHDAQEQAQEQSLSIAEGEVISAEGEFEIQPSNEVAVVDPDEVDPPVEDLDIPDQFDLPPYGLIVSCPKCGHGASATVVSDDDAPSRRNESALTTVYHHKGVLDQPCGVQFGWPNIQGLGEHLCRKCNRCGYGWAEAVQHGT